MPLGMLSWRLAAHGLDRLDNPSPWLATIVREATQHYAQLGMSLVGYLGQLELV